MTQRRLPSTATAARDVKTGPAPVADKELMGEEHCSLQVAFEELQCHLRQSRDEIARLERVKAKLRAEVDAKNISLGYLQQKLDKRSREAEELRLQLEEESSKNAELKQQLAEAQKPHGGSFPSYPWRGGSTKQAFRYPVEVDSEDAGPEDTSVWTLDGMSQLLMARMQREMKTFEQLGREVIEDLPAGDRAMFPPAEAGAQGDHPQKHPQDGSVQAGMRLIAALGAQLGTARERLLGQRAALLATLARLSGEQPKRQEERKNRASFTGPRPSDESFRVYFTQQLSAGSPNADASPGALPEEELERVCPICEVLFPRRISQDDFEGHVLEHLSGHPLVFEQAQ